MEFIILWLAFAGIAGAITNSNGRGWAIGIVMGAALGILGVIIALIIGKKLT